MLVVVLMMATAATGAHAESAAPRHRLPLPPRSLFATLRRRLLDAATTPAAATAAIAADADADRFAEATRCLRRPTASTSTRDTQGRLWGWESARTCAFRSGGRPIFYLGYEPGPWVATPACRSEPFAPNAVTVSLWKHRVTSLVGCVL